MKRTWHMPAKILTGLFAIAMSALPQAYTISAKPGVVNYVEGNVFVNGRPVSARSQKANFLNANDVISTDIGKSEVLLTPGIFLRIGNNTQVRMVSPSLVDTQVELKRGEAMIEVDNLVKDNRVSVIDHSTSVTIEKSGLYRFTADDRPTVAVLEGKTIVYFGEKKVELSKGHEAVLGPELESEKFDPKREDDLYAWSNVRSEYDAASSYQTAKNVNVNSFGGYGDYGFGGYSNPGWLWNSGFNSYAWLPGNGAFFSPFGYGFYAPGVVGYAPVIYGLGGGGYGGYGGVYGGQRLPVPVNPKNPPAIGTVTASPAANVSARAASARTFAVSGFQTGSGGTVSALHASSLAGVGTGGGHISSAAIVGNSGGHASSASNGGYSNGGYSGSSGGSSGGHLSAGVSSSGGSHGGGGGGHR